jgi:MFS family permease
VELRRNPAFAMLFSAQTLSSLGTGLTNLVMPVLVYQLTRSPAAVAAVSGIQVLPYLALGLLAGALADRLNRRTVMVVCDVSCALLLAAVPVAAALHLLVTAQVFIAALGVATAFVWFDAANFGALPTLVGRSQLPTATSLIASGGTAAAIVGPTLGAIAISVMAPAYALGLDAATYVMSALLLLSIRRPFQGERLPGKRQHIIADIAEGLRFLWNQPVIRAMTFSVCFLCMGYGGTVGLLVVYANRALHMTHVNARLGLLYSAGELGGVVAFAIVPRLVKRLPLGLLTTTFLATNAAALALLSIAPSYIWALLVFCAYEFTYVIVKATGIVVRQMLTPDHLQSRVNTAGRMIAWGGNPAGALLGGVLASILPIRIAYGLLTICVAVGAGLAGWAFRSSGSLSAVSVTASGPDDGG